MNRCPPSRRRYITARGRARRRIVLRQTPVRVWMVISVSACLLLTVSPSPARRGGLIAMPAMVAGGTGPGGATGMVPLVNADDLYAGYLRTARDQIKNGQYAPAIKVLQALIRKRDSGVVSTGDGRQFVSLWLTANQLIGSMPPAGLRHYRTLHDPPAGQLYTQAISRSDTAGLRKIVHEYLHSSYGVKAFDALGTIYFDRGRFFRAARAWRQSVLLDPKRPDKALMLAKIATAYHLGGDADATREVLHQIATDHAGAEAVLGGKKQKIAAFLAKVRTLEPLAHAPRESGKRAWSGLAGEADGLTIMDSSDVVLMPRWRRPTELSKPKLDLPADMVALKQDLAPPNNQYSSQQYSTVATVRYGHVHVTTRYGSRRSEFDCPPTLYPVVADELVLCRTDQAVTAYDAFTGEKKWDSEAFPMYRNMASLSARSNVYYGYYGMKVGDRGWHTVTVAEGKVFALGQFRPAMHSSAVSNAMRAHAKDKKRMALLTDSSTLAAMSLKGGKKLWEIGHGAGGSDEMLHASKFISAPTYHASRLYVVATYVESFYLLCLDAATGELLWKAAISQAPAVRRQYGTIFSYIVELGSSPAVSDGQVFVTTNAGVVAAFDGETGKTLWAHQYPSRVAHGTMSYSSSTAQSVFYPANPVIVTRGQVICLPSDSDNVLALSIEDGSLSWETDRKAQRHLAAIDESRVLLSAPGQLVLATGRRAAKRQLYPLVGVENKGIMGRAAVTANEAVSSGQARLWRLNLADYHSETADLGHSGGLLGNLVSTEHKLIAANAAGLCAYFNFDHARKRLSERIADAPPARRPGLVYQRAQLAFNAKRFGEARDDLLKCAELARVQGDEQLPFSVRPWLYRAYVALGNRAESGAEMLAMFHEARNRSETDQEKAHMLLRLAKYHEKAGDYEASAALAQELGEKYAAEELVDVKIGDKANDMVRFGADRDRTAGKQLAQAYINRLIEAHGPGIYAQFDGRAKTALDKARKAGDPEAMVAVARQWEHSSVADDALFAAAETYYMQALPLHDKAAKLKARGTKLGDQGRDMVEQAQTLSRQAESLFSKAVHDLSEVANRPDSELRLAANVAVAVIYARRGYETTASITCDEIRRLCKQRKGWSLDAKVRFGEINGTVEGILKSVESGKLPAPTIAPTDTSSISLPLRKVFTITDTSVQVLRDQDYRPVRMGQFIFVVKGANVLLFDTLADNEETAVRWSGMTTVDPAEQERYYSYPPGWRLVGALSKNNKVLVIADRKSVAGLDVQSGKVKWRTELGEVGVSKFGCISTGDGVMLVASQDGNMSCMDLATGQVRWQARLSGRNRYLSGSPYIGGGVVLAVNNSGREVNCYSLRTGKLLAKWAAASYAQAAVSRRGYVVLMLDDTLTVREVAKLAETPIWSRKYAETHQVGGRKVKDYPTILRLAKDRIVVSPSQYTNQIEVLSLPAFGQVMARLQTSDVSGQAGLPADAWFDDGHLYVACTVASTTRRKQAYGRFSTTRGLSVQRFSLNGTGRKTKADWNCDVDIDPRNTGQVMPPTITGSHVVAFSKHYQTNRAIHALVINAASGKVLTKIDLVGKGEDAAVRTKRQRMIGPPVITNGRMCVETCEGITVYGGQ